jgi:hypothetical protein
MELISDHLSAPNGGYARPGRQLGIITKRDWTVAMVARLPVWTRELLAGELPSLID